MEKSAVIKHLIKAWLLSLFSFLISMMSHETNFSFDCSEPIYVSMTVHTVCIVNMVILDR